MNIILYHSDYMSNVVHKTNLTEVATLPLKFKGEYNEETPTVVLKTNLDLSNANYAKIEDNYYFIDPGTRRPINGFVTLQLRMDYLMTDQKYVEKIHAYLARSSQGFDYIPDSTKVLSCKSKTEKVKIGDGFGETMDDGVYILVTSQNGYHTVGGA